MRSVHLSVATVTALAAGVGTNVGWAQLNFDSGRSVITYRHRPDSVFSSSFAQARSVGSAFASTLNDGQSSTTARATISSVTNSTTASFSLASGSGVTQSNPNDEFSGFSELNIDFNLRWNVGANGWGGGAGGLSGFPRMYTSFRAVGVVGAGGFARVIQALNFNSFNSSGSLLRTGSVNFDQTFASTGTFSQQFTSPNALLGGVNQALPANSYLTLSGTLKFRAKNDTSPSDIQLFDAQFGAINNSLTYRPPAGGSGLWHDAARWNPSPDLFAGATPGGFAQTTDSIALFTAADSETQTHTVLLNDPPLLAAGTTSFAAMEFDDRDSYIISPATPGNTLRVSSIVHSSVNGTGQVTINTPVQLYQSSTIDDADRRGFVIGKGLTTTLNGPITIGTPAQSPIMQGDGTLVLNAASGSLSTSFFVRRGIVVMNDPLALGTQPPTIHGTLIEGVTASATFLTSAQALNVKEGGVLSLAPGVTPRPTLPSPVAPPPFPMN